MLAPDIAVIQECAKPTTHTDRCLWFGDNPRQGIAVIANGSYQLRALPPLREVPRYVIPIEVLGPIRFLLIAVWAQREPDRPYVEGVVRAVQLYRHLFAEYRTVLIGDLNSNAIWDTSHSAGFNHSALVKLLSELGLVSGYHHFHREPHGAEKQPTYYFQWKEDRPYHIDYCFIPMEWAPNLRRVDVGSFSEWKSYSDHRPIVVDLADNF